jgi:hypothetical protein
MRPDREEAAQIVIRNRTGNELSDCHLAPPLSRVGRHSVASVTDHRNLTLFRSLLLPAATFSPTRRAKECC